MKDDDNASGLAALGLGADAENGQGGRVEAFSSQSRPHVIVIETSGAVIVDGALVEVDAAQLAAAGGDPYAVALMLMRAEAAELGRPVRALACDEDGQTHLVIHPDGHVTSKAARQRRGVAVARLGAPGIRAAGVAATIAVAVAVAATTVGSAPTEEISVVTPSDSTSTAPPAQPAPTPSSTPPSATPSATPSASPAVKARPAARPRVQVDGASDRVKVVIVSSTRGRVRWELSNKWGRVIDSRVMRLGAGIREKFAVLELDKGRYAWRVTPLGGGPAKAGRVVVKSPVPPRQPSPNVPVAPDPAPDPAPQPNPGNPGSNGGGGGGGNQEPPSPPAPSSTPAPEPSDLPDPVES